MAGIVSGFLSGMEFGEQQDRRRAADIAAAQERAYQQQRRTVMDQRDTVAFDQGQEDRTMRQAEHMEDRGYLTSVERPRADRRAAREERISDFKESRLPVEAERDDQKFLWQMQREKRDAHADGLRQQLMQYGLDEKRVEADARQAAEAFKPAVAAYARTKDPRVFAEWANQTVAKDDPIVITQGEDGNWILQSRSGQPQVLGTGDDVMRVARMLTNPDVFLEFQASQAKQRAEAAAAERENPGRFYELVNDETGALMQVDQRTGQARPVMRDGGQAPLVGTKAGAFGSRAGELTLGVRRPGQAQAGPMEPQFREGNPAAVTPQQRAMASQLAAGRAPAAAPPQQRTIVRTGTDKQGRRVAQYSDGTIGPLP